MLCIESYGFFDIEVGLMVDTGLFVHEVFAKPISLQFEICLR